MPKKNIYDFVFHPEKEIGKRFKPPGDTDKKVKCCPRCKRVWQWEYLYIGDDKHEKEIYYLDEIPSLGKTREICINC